MPFKTSAWARRNSAGVYAADWEKAGRFDVLSYGRMGHLPCNLSMSALACSHQLKTLERIASDKATCRY
jgi:hypothetical protein